ncbi:MAG: endolytic transglycosylase MltG [Solirubrobacteraceae bacterium]|jgi:UPF0755 protein
MSWWGGGRGGEQSGRRRGAHPAGGGDWAGDLDWVDPHAPPPPKKTGGLRGLLFSFPRGGPRSAKSRRIMIRRTVALAILAVVIFGVWFLVALFQPFHGSGSGSVTVEIPPGSSASQIGDLLSHDGVISSSFFFNLRASLAGDGGKLQPGVYTLKHGMSYGAALAALTAAGSSTREIIVTVPPGLTRAQVAALAKKAGLRGNYARASEISVTGLDPQAYGAHPGVYSPEGFLFPDTYYLYPHENVSGLVLDQLDDFRANFKKVNLSYAESKNLTPYDVITIASIIPREAKLASDGPKVAAVIYNRLRLQMPLGLDTTLLYYLHDPPGGLTNADLRLTTPYNTRRSYGLPPTPISNPDLQALDWAAHPANVNYLYFIDKPDACGALTFTASFPQFEVDEAAWNAAVKVGTANGCPSATSK